MTTTPQSPTPGATEGRLRFRLTYADVDAVQFYFADYYRWMERAFAELIDAAGYPRAAASADGVGFPVVESGCRYLKRATVDQHLTVVARFGEIGNRSFRVDCRFLHDDGSVAAEGFTRHVCVDIDAMAARAVPDAFRTAAGL